MSESGDEIRNLADAVRQSATRTPAAPALVSHDTTLTWADLDEAVDRMAAGLSRLGLAPDRAPARVAIALPNVPDFAVAFFGALRAGLVAVPTNPGYTARELRHALGDSDAAVLVGTGAVLQATAEVRAELPALRHVYAGGGSAVPGVLPMSDLLVEPLATPLVTAGSGEDLAVLLYTSGTTGAPKGAMLTHRALISNHLQVDKVQPAIVSQGDVVLLALPMFHAFGLNSGLGSIAWHGACGVLVERFDPAETLAMIARHRVSVVTAVPQMYLAWSFLTELGESFGTVRVAVSGAAPLDRATAKRFLDAIHHPLSEGYGLTETAPVVATALASPQPKIGSVGRPLPGIEVKLVARDGSEICRVDASGPAAPLSDDFDDDAGGVPGTDPGQIVVRGQNLFSGYWPDGSEGPDAEGWWPTGDIAYADPDGDLFLVDRLDELILVSGFNVYPHEIELVLASHPAVAEAAVVGVPNPYTGEAVKAVVVLRGTATSEDLLSHCERNLARFKCPTIIEFVPQLPYSATGKVRKGTFRPDAAESAGA
jgi:long-chain acyl-CoA synthetase